MCVFLNISVQRLNITSSMHRYFLNFLIYNVWSTEAFQCTISQDPGNRYLSWIKRLNAWNFCPQLKLYSIPQQFLCYSFSPRLPDAFSHIVYTALYQSGLASWKISLATPFFVRQRSRRSRYSVKLFAWVKGDSEGGDASRLLLAAFHTFPHKEFYIRYFPETSF